MRDAARLGLAFAASLPLSAVFARLAGFTGAEGVEANLAFWGLAGLPMSAAVLGASSAKELLRPGSRASQQLRPFAPRDRIIACLLSAWVQLLLLGLAVLGAAALVGRGPKDLLARVVQMGPSGVPLPGTVDEAVACYAGLLLCTVAHSLLASFACCLAFGHAVLGALLGFTVSAAGAAVISAGLALHSAFGPSFPFAPWAALGAGTAILGAIAALDLWSPRLEGRRARTRRRGLALLLAGGGLAAVSGFALSSHRLSRTLLPVRTALESGAWRARAGAFFEGVAGDLVWVTPDGRRARAVPGESARRALLDGPAPGGRVLAIDWEEDGGVWVRRERDWAMGLPVAELWHGRPGELFQLEAPFGLAAAQEALLRDAVGSAPAAGPPDFGLPSSGAEIPGVGWVVPVAEGFFVHTGERLYFMDRSRRARDLGPA